MTVHAPRFEGAVHEAILAGAAHVIHDLVMAVLLDGLPHPASDLFQGGVPRDLLPLARPALAHPAHWVEDPLRVVHLIERCRALGAVAAA